MTITVVHNRLLKMGQRLNRTEARARVCLDKGEGMRVKTETIVLLSATAILMAGTMRAAPPVLKSGVKLADAAGTPIQVTAFAAPEVVDWNGDGLKDLLVGYSLHDFINMKGSDRGNVELFVNLGGAAIIFQLWMVVFSARPMARRSWGGIRLKITALALR